MLLTGRVVTGLGAATAITALHWFRSAVRSLGGFELVPGTLNIEIEETAAFSDLLLRSATTLVPPTEATCCAFLLGVRLRASGGEVRGIVVRPLTDKYNPAQVEVVADRRIRDALGLKDGDTVELVLEALPGPRWLQPAPEICGGLATAGHLAETISLSTGEQTLHAAWIATGHGIMLSLVGGLPHLGAVAQAVPRPSLKDPAQQSSTSSVLTLPGHKDDVVARLAAERLAAALGQNVAVAAGIHIGPAGSYDAVREDLAEVGAGVKRLSDRVAQILAEGGFAKSPA